MPRVQIALNEVMDEQRTPDRRIAGRLFGLLLAALAASALGYLVLGTPLRVRQVIVTGDLLLDRAAVVQAADVLGANPFRVQTSAVEQRVLGLGVPASARVHVELPDAVVIQITEKTPAYLWKVDPTLYLVSADGVILAPTTSESRRVIVVDADRRPVRVGDRVDVRILREAAYLMTVLPNTAGLSPRYVLYSRALGVVVPTPDGLQVAFGDDRQLTEKAAEAAAVLQAARQHQPRPTLVDLGVADHPYFR